MKIGITTFQRADNYGALLQCYALFRCVEKIDENVRVEVIDYRNSYVERRYVGLPNFRLNVFGWLKSFYNRKKNYKTIMKKHEAFEKLRNHITFSKSYVYREIKKNGLEYDMIIAGSDQVWNPGITNGYDSIYYLDFPGKFYRCAYAVSLGNSELPFFRTSRFIKSVNRFQKISLREKQAAGAISELVGKEIECCVDPTLLLDRDEWQELVKKNPPILTQPYLLLYHLDNNPELIKIAKFIAKEQNLQIVSCNEKAGEDNDIIWLDDIGPLEFLKLIKDAQMVVTSSFHATVFSIIFEKELYLTCHPTTGERIRSLAEMCGVSQRICASFDEFLSKYSDNEMLSIDFETMELYRQYSLGFLKKAYNEAMMRKKNYE